MGNEKDSVKKCTKSTDSQFKNVTKKLEVSDRVPPFLVPAVLLDKRASSWLAVCASQSSVMGSLRKQMKMLEISCHGIPWLAGSLGAIYMFKSLQMQQLFVNLLIALLLDCFFVAVIKAAVRRKRPDENVDDMFATVSLDGYSFPSGHASRAVLIFFIFLFKCEPSFLLILLFGAWSSIVCLSRIALARHHVGDVLAGCGLGYLEYCLAEFMWFSSEGTKNILSYLEIDGDEL